MKKIYSTLLLLSLFTCNLAFAETAVFYPVAGSNAPVDGNITSGYQVTMSAMHSNTTGDGSSDTNTNAALRILHNGSGYYANRLGFLFDTSSLGSSTITITGATLSLYHSSVIANDSNTAAVVVGFNPASNATVQTTDFGFFSYTALSAPINFTDINAGSYNDYVLNSSGIAQISTGWYTKLGLLTELDRSNTSFTLGEDNLLDTTFADNGTQKPKLIVTYTVNGSSSPATTTAGTYDGLNSAEMLFLFGIFLFVYSLKNWGVIFGPFNQLLKKE